MANAGAIIGRQAPEIRANVGVAPPAFCAGAEISLPDGTQRIDFLSTDDFVATSDARVAPLTWVGRRRIDPDLLPPADADNFLPIRIIADALDTNLPLRDLEISPTALLWLDDGLVAAGALVNGVTITQPARDQPIDYRQVVIDGGGLLLAEGVAIATLDDLAWGNSFSDPDGLSALHAFPDLHRHGADASRQVRQRLALRAAWLGIETTPEPALRLMVDGAILWPSRRDGDLYHFEVTGGARDVRLVSRAVVPAEMPDAGPDQRRLGVFILAITLRAPHMRFEINPGAASLDDGFHPAAPGKDHCWTDGYARLPPAPFTLLGDVFEVEIRIAAPDLRYRSNPNYADPVALVLDASLPTPDRDAGSNVIVAQIKLLQALGYAVVFVPLHNFARISPYAEALEALGVEVIHRPWYDDLAHFIAVRGATFAFAYIHRLWVAEHALPVLRRACPDLKIVFNTADLHYLRSQRAAILTGDAEAAKAAEDERRRELSVIAGSDATIVCNSVERDLLRAELPDAKVSYLPWVRAPELEPIPDFTDRAGIMFLGGFNHPPNADGITWFVREVMPKLRAQLPGISLTIYGADMPAGILALGAPDIIVAGHVAALKPAFDRHRVSVAPLRYGAGFKGKVAESLAYGVPIVASPIAAEGTGLIDDVNVLVAEGADLMATAIVRVYGNRDLWASLSQAGQNFVAEHLSPAAGQRVLRAILDDFGM